MNFNTGNPIGSIDEEDFYDNCYNLDQAMNSTDSTFVDRFGVEKPTIDAALKAAGFMPAGFDFTSGGTLQAGDRNKAVYNPLPNGDNNWYRWNGSFPKEIPAGSQPNPKDAVSWVPVIFKLSATIKEALRRTYQEIGFNLVDGSFEEGATLNTANDLILEEKTGNCYAWAGTLPKTVNKGTLFDNNSNWKSKSNSSLIELLKTGSGNITPVLEYPAIPARVGSLGEELDFQTQSLANQVHYLKETTLPYLNEGYDVFIVYGQSNAVGYANGTAGFPTVDPRAKYWNYQTKQLEPIISNIKLSSGEVSTGHAWAAFANEYIRKTGRKVIIIPCAKGGTAIAGLAKGSSVYNNMTTSLGNFEAYVAANNINVLSRSLCWHQGETDMSDGTTHNDYIVALDQLLRDIRSDFSVNKTFIWRVGCPQNRKEGAWYGIQSAQDFIAQSYDWVVMVYKDCGAFTLGNGLLREGVHYTQNGYNLMGHYGAQAAATALLEKSPSSEAEMDMYGTILTTPDQIWRYTYGRCLLESTGFKLLDIDETSYAYRACNIKSIETLTDRLRFNIQSRANYFMGFEARLNKAGKGYGITAVTQVEVTGTNTWAIDVYFYRDIEFMLSMDTGAIANPDGSTGNVYPWILNLITSELISTGHYRIQHPAIQGVPVITPFYSENALEANVKPIFVTSVSTTSCRLKTFSGTGAKALVNLKNVPIPPSALPTAIQVELVALVASKKL